MHSFVHPHMAGVNQATGETGLAVQYAELCDEYQDVFRNEPGLPPRRPLDQAIDLIDGSLPSPKHR